MIPNYESYWRDKYHTGFCVLFIFVTLVIGLYPTFVGTHTFLSGDNIWFYGPFQYFVQNTSQGVFPLWTPYHHSGEPFYFLINHFRLIDPLVIFPVIVARLFQVDIFSLFHAYYAFRVFVYLLGLLLLLQYLFRDRLQTTLTFLLALGVVNFYGIFSSFFHLDNHCWVPWIALFAIRAYSEKRLRFFVLAAYFLGISIGATTYLSLFFLAFIAVFIFSALIYRPRDTSSFCMRYWIPLILSSTVVVLLSLPLFALYLDRESILPVTRIFGARDELGNFFSAHAFNQSYEKIFGGGAVPGHYLKWENLIIYVMGRGHGPDALFHFFVFLAIFYVRFDFKIPLLVSALVMYLFALGGETPFYYPFFFAVPGFDMLRHTIGFIDCLVIFKAIFAAYGLRYFILSYRGSRIADVARFGILLLPFLIQMTMRAEVRFLGGYDVPWGDINFIAVGLLTLTPLMRLADNTRVRSGMLAMLVVCLTYYTVEEFSQFSIPRDKVVGLYKVEDFKTRRVLPDTSRALIDDHDSQVLYEGLITQENMALSMLLEPEAGRSLDSIAYVKHWPRHRIGNRSIYWPFNYTHSYLLGEDSYELFSDLHGIGGRLFHYYPENQAVFLEVSATKDFLRTHYANGSLGRDNVFSSLLFLHDSDPENSSEYKSVVDLKMLKNPPHVPEYQITEFDTNNIEIQFEAPLSGYFLYLDSFDTNWTATVNGISNPIFLANLNFKAVKIKAGLNTVRFSYQPRFYVIAVCIFLAITVILIASQGLIVLRKIRRVI